MCISIEDFGNRKTEWWWMSIYLAALWTQCWRRKQAVQIVADSRHLLQDFNNAYEWCRAQACKRHKQRKIIMGFFRKGAVASWCANLDSVLCFGASIKDSWQRHCWIFPLPVCIIIWELCFAILYFTFNKYPVNFGGSNTLVK